MTKKIYKSGDKRDSYLGCKFKMEGHVVWKILEVIYNSKKDLTIIKVGSL